MALTRQKPESEAEINRREQLRLIKEQVGGKTLANTLGITDSNLLQMIGNSYIRVVSTDKARKYEKALGLKQGALDKPLVTQSGVTPAPASALPFDEPTPKPARAATDDEITAAMNVARIVGSIEREENVSLPDEKFQDLSKLIMVDMAGHPEKPNLEYVRSLVRLAK